MSKLRLTDKLSKFRTMKSRILEEMANNAIHQFKVENFDAQGFIDTQITKWAPRKGNKDPGRKILVKTGRLRQSITVISREGDNIIVGTNVPYGKYHNEGTIGSVNTSGGGFLKSVARSVLGSVGLTKGGNLPKRQFMGKSAKLEAKNKRVLDAALGRL